MSDATVALLTLAVVIVVFMINRLPVGVVAIAAALSLWATGLLTLDQALAGFGDPVVIFIATLFVVSEAIDSSGLTTWAGQKIIAIAGEGPSRVLVALMITCAGLTALISLNGSVAALLPMVVMLAMRMGRAPSRMLMPVVYAGSAGSLLVLMGSPVNVIVSEASKGAGEGTFGFFEFAIVGIPILVATVVLCTLLVDRVLPRREPDVAPPNLSRHAEALAAQYELSDGFYRLRVRDRSSLVGQDRAALELDPRLNLVAVEPHGGRETGGPVAVDDVLVITGPTAQVSALVVDAVLAVAMTPLTEDGSNALLTREAGVAELVVPPRSPLVGESVFAGMRRASDLVILAVQRQGRYQGDAPTVLAPGDALLVYGAWPALDALVDDRDVLVVDSPDLLRRQTVSLGATAARTAAIVGAMVVLLALGLVPPAAAGLLAVLGLVLSGAVRSADAYKAVSWETVVLVGGLIPLSAAAETGISVRPVLMLVAVAGSAALLTPVQTPGNMMVMAPAGYRFGDYWRLGLPLVIAWLVIALVVIPLAWPFTP